MALFVKQVCSFLNNCINVAPNLQPDRTCSWYSQTLQNLSSLLPWSWFHAVSCSCSANSPFQQLFFSYMEVKLTWLCSKRNIPFCFLSTSSVYCTVDIIALRGESGKITFSHFLSLQTEALKCVAQASKNRSLADFEKVSQEKENGKWLVKAFRNTWVESCRSCYFPQQEAVTTNVCRKQILSNTQLVLCFAAWGVVVCLKLDFSGFEEPTQNQFPVVLMMFTGMRTFLKVFLGVQQEHYKEKGGDSYARE